MCICWDFHIWTCNTQLCSDLTLSVKPLNRLWLKVICSLSICACMASLTKRYFFFCIVKNYLPPILYLGLYNVEFELRFIIYPFSIHHLFQRTKNLNLFYIRVLLQLIDLFLVQWNKKIITLDRRYTPRHSWGNYLIIFATKKSNRVMPQGNCTAKPLWFMHATHMCSWLTPITLGKGLVTCS